jgi:hypothetical protein
MVAISAENSSLTEDYSNCRRKIRECMDCEKNSFLNPVICYCGERLSSKIGIITYILQSYENLNCIYLSNIVKEVHIY